MPKYNKIGKEYNLNRSADTRIIKQLIQLLNLQKGSLIADIGAGTGNYSNELATHGFHVHAIEPSDLMISQAKKNPNVVWIKGTAEEVKLKKCFYDGIVSTLAFHHFNSIDKALSNIHKALKQEGVLVIFGADPRRIDDKCWFKEYFGNMIKNSENTYIDVFKLIEKAESIFDETVTYKTFNVPYDIEDGFFYAGWQKPEKYLEENFRKSISVFAKSSNELISNSVSKLYKDLHDGTWDKKFGHVRNQKEYNGGYYFLRVKRK